MNPKSKPLWRIVGQGKNGPVTIKVRADNYSEAVARAKACKMDIRDVVLIESNP